MKATRKIAIGWWVCLGLALPMGHVMAQQPAEMLLDERDGKSYPTVVIGEQCWMAANLDVDLPGKLCYENNPEHCAIYGGLYTWELAQEACPAGWRLPSVSDWEELSGFLGEANAGQQIKASKEDELPWDGSNSSGFTALPAGAGNGEGFHRQGDWALFWTSDENGGQRACFAQLDGFWYEAPPKYPGIYLGSYYLKSNLFSVRCVQ